MTIAGKTAFLLVVYPKTAQNYCFVATNFARSARNGINSDERATRGKVKARDVGF